MLERVGRGRLSSPLPYGVLSDYDRAGDDLDLPVVELSNGVELAFRPSDAQGLEKATPAELAEIEISPAGLGLHFPKLDADFYVPGLLAGQLGSKAWMAARLGREGGKARTPLVVTYHPAYLLRSPTEKRKAWEDLKFARQVAAGASA